MSSGMPYVLAIGVESTDLLTIPALLTISPNTPIFIASTLIVDVEPELDIDIEDIADKEDKFEGSGEDNI